MMLALFLEDQKFSTNNLEGGLGTLEKSGAAGVFFGMLFIFRNVMGFFAAIGFKASTSTNGVSASSSTGIMTMGLLVMSSFFSLSLFKKSFDSKLCKMSLAVNQRLGGTLVLLIRPSDVLGGDKSNFFLNCEKDILGGGVASSSLRGIKLISVDVEVEVDTCSSIILMGLSRGKKDSLLKLG